MIEIHRLPGRGFGSRMGGFWQRRHAIMKAETKKALKRLDAAIGKLESGDAKATPAPAAQAAAQVAARTAARTAEPGMKAEVAAIRKIVDEAIGLLDQPSEAGGGSKS